MAQPITIGAGGGASGWNVSIPALSIVAYAVGPFRPTSVPRMLRMMILPGAYSDPGQMFLKVFVGYTDRKPGTDLFTSLIMRAVVGNAYIDGATYYPGLPGLGGGPSFSPYVIQISLPDFIDEERFICVSFESGYSIQVDGSANLDVIIPFNA